MYELIHMEGPGKAAVVQSVHPAGMRSKII